MSVLSMIVPATPDPQGELVKATAATFVGAVERLALLRSTRYKDAHGARSYAVEQQGARRALRVVSRVATAVGSLLWIVGIGLGIAAHAREDRFSNASELRSYQVAAAGGGAALALTAAGSAAAASRARVKGERAHSFAYAYDGVTYATVQLSSAAANRKQALDAVAAARLPNSRVSVDYLRQTFFERSAPSAGAGL
jgi:hypothetical protein